MSSIGAGSSWLIGRARQDIMTNFGVTKYVNFSLSLDASLTLSLLPRFFSLSHFKYERKKITRIFCLLATLYKFAIMNESNTDKEPKRKKTLAAAITTTTKNGKTETKVLHYILHIAQTNGKFGNVANRTHILYISAAHRKLFYELTYLRENQPIPKKLNLSKPWQKFYLPLSLSLSFSCFVYKFSLFLLIVHLVSDC